MNKFEYEYNGRIYKVINPGRIVRIDEIFYQNQLEDVNNDMSVKFTKRKPPFKKYGLSEQEYYNLVVYGELEHHEMCECDTCIGKDKRFNGLAYGYSKFCSGTCAKLQKGYNKSKFLKDLYKLGLNPIYSKESRCKSDYNRLMKSKLHKCDDVYSLYIAIPTFEKNSIKIGVTSCINRRSTSFQRNDYSSIELVCDCRLDIAAEVEYKTKVEFISESIGKYTEVFNINKLNDIVNFMIQSLNNYGLYVSSTTIERLKNLVE